MKLTELSQLLGARARGPLNAAVDRVEYDSRRVTSRSVFAAVRGAKLDGHLFAGEAMARGAAGILSENPPPEGISAAWLQVGDIRLSMAMAAAALAEYPSRQLQLAGITGTNGKTTTAYLLNSIYEATGEKSAMLGTISYQIAGSAVEAERTTPEAPDIQRYLQRAVQAGCRRAVMEVSSHAIDLKRVHGCEFTAAVFTNLTRDHLDYHKTMDAYFEVKRRLFEGVTGRTPDHAVINRDDRYGLELLNTVQSSKLSYGLTAEADVHPQRLDMLGTGLRFVAETPAGHVQVMSELIGQTNAYNLLACVAAAVALQIDVKSIEAGIANCRAVPGRFETIREGQDFTVIVDYAHTDDALRNVLQTARRMGPHRIITVFGCGGDRDPGKRAPMGRIAAEMSDLVIITSDNPRGEDPADIIRQIGAGVPAECSSVVKMVDRRDAIGLAIEEAQTGDLVLLAGKGHEGYQIIGEQTLSLDDREVARELLRKRIARNDRYHASGLNSVLSVAV